jgi:hypothetical protein
MWCDNVNNYLEVLMNKCEQLKATLLDEIAAIEAASPVTLEVKEIGENSQTISNKRNFKSMSLDYIPDKDFVMVEVGGRMRPQPITLPIREMAVGLLMQITGR